MSHQFLILGLLSERPMTGYDIKKEVEQILSDITSASYGTLYPTLHKLLQEGAVEVREIPQRGRPSKKVYRITRDGEGKLAQWLAQPAAADQVRREFLLKLYLAKDIPSQQLRDLIQSRLTEVEEKVEALQAGQNQTEALCQQWVLDYILRQCEAEIDWLKQIEAQLEIA